MAGSVGMDKNREGLDRVESRDGKSHSEKEGWIRSLELRIIDHFLFEVIFFNIKFDSVCLNLFKFIGNQALLKFCNILN